MAVIEHPLGGLIEGMMQGRKLAMDLHRQAQEDAAFQTNQALHEQQMTMQDIFNQDRLQKIARPVSDIGTVMLGGVERKAKSPVSVSDRFGNKTRWEYKTPEERQQEELQAEVGKSNALREAQTKQAMQERESQLKFYRGGTPAPAGAGYPEGYPLLPKEYQEALNAITARQKGDELVVPEGSTVFSRAGLRGGTPGVAGPEAPPEMQDVPQPGGFPGRLPLAPPPPGYETPATWGTRPGVETPTTWGTRPGSGTPTAGGMTGSPQAGVIARGQPKATGEIERVAIPIIAAKNGMTVEQLRQPQNATKLLAGLTEWAQRTGDPAARELARQTARLHLQIAQQHLEDMKAKRSTEATDIPVGSREYKLASDLAFGKLTFRDFTKLYARSMDINKRIDVYNKATDINPNFNPALFTMGYQFASSPKVQQQLAAMDNVVRGSEDLLRISDAASRTGVTALNQFVNKAGYAIGGKKYANLHAAQIGFADELSGALGFGGATDMSKQMGIDMTDPNLPPEEFRSNIEDLVIPFINRKRAATLGQMGIYGQPGMNPAADIARQQTGGAGAIKIIVHASDGLDHPFDTEKQASDFEKDVKAAGGTTQRK